MSTSASLALPLCDCVISRTIFEALPKYSCKHGFIYLRENVLEYNEVIASMVSLDRRASELEDVAMAWHSEQSGVPAATPVTSSYAAPKESYWVEAPAEQSAAASVQVGSKAPVAKKQQSLAPERKRPQRNLPKLSPQQTLLAVAAGLVVIALSVFFATSWTSIDLWGKAGVVVLLVASTAVGSIWSKKYFTIVSNFLAGLSAFFLGVGLWAASSMGLLDTSWADPSKSPYVSFVLVLVATYGLLLGRRFKIFGWLATAPIALTAGLLLFIAVSSNSLTQGLGLGDATMQAIKSLVASAAIFAAIAVGRMTRYELSNFAIDKKSSKKLSKEESDDKAEREYQTGLHKREQNALRLTYRSTAAVLFAYSAWMLANLALGVFSLASVTDSAQFLTALPSVFALIPLAALWWFTARLAGQERATKLLGGDVRAWIPLSAWIYTAVVIAISLTTVSLTLSTLATQSRMLSPLGILISVSVGAILLFVPGQKFFTQNVSALIPVRLAAMSSWLLWLGLQTGIQEQQLPLALWLGLIAIVLAAKSFVDRDARYAQAHLILAGLALSLFSFRSSELLWWPSTVVGVALAASMVSFFIYQLLLRRADSDLTLPALFVQPLVAIIAISAVGSWGIDVNIMMVVTLAYITLNVLLSISKKLGSDVGLAPTLSALAVSIVSYLQLSVLSSIGGEVSQLRLAIFSGVLFALNVFHSMRSSIKFSGLLAHLPLVIFAYSLNALVLPYQLPFAGFAPLVGLAVIMVGHWLVKSKAIASHNLVTGAGLVGYALVLLDSMTALADGTVDLLTASERVSLPLTVSVVGLVAFGLVPQIVRLRRGESKHFDWSFTMVASIMTLGSTLITSLAVMHRSAVVLQLIALASVAALALISVRSKQEVLRVQVWSYVAIAFVPLAAAHLLNSVLFAYYLFDDYGTLVHGAAVPLNILLAALVLRLIGVRLSDAGAKLSWWIRPIAAGIGAVAGSIAPTFISNYVIGVTQPMMNPTLLQVDVVAFSIVAVIFTIFRVRDFDNRDTQRGVLANTLLTFGFGAGAIQIHATWIGFATMSAYAMPPAFDFGNLMQSILILVFAILFNLVSYLKRDALSAYLGYAFALAGSTLLLQTTWNINSLHLLQLFSFAAIVTYVLATALLKRADAKASEMWGWILPITTLLANVIAVANLNAAAVGNGWFDFAVATLLGYLYIFALVSPRLTLLGKAKSSLLASAAVSWIFAGYIGTSLPSDARDLGLSLLFVVISASMVTLLRAMKNIIVVATSYISLAVAGFLLASYLHSLGVQVSDNGPEIYALLVALSFVANGMVFSRSGLLADRLRTLVRHGLPLLTIALPSVLTSLSVVAEPITSLTLAAQVRLIALLVLGAGLLVLGMRRGNLGVSLAGGVAFGLTLLPQIWFRIDEFLQGKLESEIKFAYVAILIYAAISALQSQFAWKINSIVVLGVPLSVALVPALYDTVTALDAVEMTTEDWVRFLIVLGGSLIVLILGALRKLAGFFVPGVVGVAVSAVPYLWKPLSQQQWLLWVVLVLVAAVLVWVAIRLEQFKSGVRSANAWLRELK